ncbi:MAG: zinc carboxypeptidase [Saprospiraceae bacterium]|nr:zinc carboxypeptidase [Saprospiraceae bacterium]
MRLPVTLLLSAFLALPFALSAQIKSPDAFFPHQPGVQYTRHDQLTDYFEYLAANATQTMRLERYGMTNEDRPLQVAYFSAPENMARLEQIRVNNLRLAGVADGTPDLSNPIAIVWLSMSVHGNEASGSECSPELAYRLATQTDPQIREWLKNTVVVLDPSLNPDGYSRYTNWFRGVSGPGPNVNPEAREHREPWPSGRTNHYYFDLNRDWAWATQAESRQRIVLYQKWLPQVHADLHEQYVDNPYYFAPAAEPMHDYITPWQREFQTQIGQNHARYFDANGWLYFTKEVFDLFYPSYGDTYPMFNGAIGMTYEQAGNSSAGRAIITGIGDTLTLADRMEHHLTTSLSTIEIASKNARAVVENFRNYYSRSATQPQGAYVSFVIRAGNDPNKVNALCQLLDLHHVRYGLAGASSGNLRGWDYVSSQEASVTIQPNDLVISAYQPHGTFVQVLFEPSPRLSDSLTYDITAWALPYAYGLDAVALKSRLEPKKAYEPYKAPEVRLAASPYAWCVHRRSLAEAKFLADILDKGVKVRYSMKPFALADQQFEAGALVINRADNHAMAGELDGIVLEAARKSNVNVHAMFSGFAGAGRDLGSDSYVPLFRPNIALVYGEEVDDNSFGHAWFFFDHDLKYPVTALPLDKLGRVKLNDYNILIFPNGYYNLPEATLKQLQDWVRGGGRIIAYEGAVKAFADKDGFALKSKADPKKDTTETKPKPYQSRERDGISDQLPGAIVKTKVDNTHPLGFGLPDYYFSLKTTASAFELPDKATTVVWLGDNYTSSGFIGSRVRPRLNNTPVVAVQRMGEGQIVYFVDNPLYRCFWEQGKVLFSNALFF